MIAQPAGVIKCLGYKMALYVQRSQSECKQCSYKKRNKANEIIFIVSLFISVHYLSIRKKY